MMKGRFAVSKDMAVEFAALMAQVSAKNIFGEGRGDHVLRR